MRKWRNYILAAICCIACSVLAALGGSVKLKWLLISDLNVFIWLYVAYLFDDKE